MKYSVIVEFSCLTVEALNKGGYSLCCFIACESFEGAGGFPLCWNITTDFLNSVRISWYDEFIAYYSTSILADRSSIFIPQPIQPIIAFTKKTIAEAATSRRITVKERMIVDRYGLPTVEADESINNVMIQNNSKRPYVAGMGVKNNDESYYGICGLNLYGCCPLGIKPIPTIFIAIVPETTIIPNMAVGSLDQIGVIVDVSGSPTASRVISYDINTGWSPNVSWIKQYPAQYNLGKLLIQKPNL